MPFSDPIVAGTTLVRDAIRSADYVAGVSGWSIERAGSAEFHDIVARGDITARVVRTADSGQRVLIEVASSPGITGPFAFLRMSNAGENGLLESSRAAAVYSRSQLHTDGRPFQYVYLDSGEPTQDGVAYGDPARLVCVSATDNDSTTPYLSVAANRLQAPRLLTTNRTDVTLTSVNHDLQLGLSDGPNLAAESDEIQARDNGAAATLFLNNHGGGIVTPDMRPVESYGSVAGTTTSTTYTPTLTGASEVTLTLPYPPSGAVMVGLYLNGRNDTAGAATVMSFEIRDTDAAGFLRAGADDQRSTVTRETAAPQFSSGPFLITGLPTSGTLFARLMHRVTSSTGTYQRRRLIVIPCP